MANQERTIWGIHAGKTGDADTLFLKKKFVGVGWPKCGNLGNLPPDREAFKELVAKSHPGKKPGAIPGCAGQLYRFVHEMKPGDLIVYPSRRNHTINIGRITGPYKFNPDLEPTYPNLRCVEWLKTVPRTQFTQGALYEIGAAMSLFQVKSYADEFVAVVEGKPPADVPGKDPTVGLVAEEIEQTTSDFILKQLSKELKGHPLAHFVANLLQQMGYRTRVSPEGSDGGIDIIAHKDELGFEPPIIKVQVKSGGGSIGDPDVSALYGKVGNGEFGLFVALAAFTAKAENFARSKSNLRLIDGSELVTLILQHYEELDSRYKGLLPLKKVYVPEALEEAEE